MNSERLSPAANALSVISLYWSMSSFADTRIDFRSSAGSLGRPLEGRELICLIVWGKLKFVTIGSGMGRVVFGLLVIRKHKLAPSHSDPC